MQDRPFWALRRWRRLRAAAGCPEAWRHFGV